MEETKSFSELFKNIRVLCFRYSFMFSHSLIPAVNQFGHYPPGCGYSGHGAKCSPSCLWWLRRGSSSEGAATKHPESAPWSLCGSEISSHADSLLVVWGQRRMTSLVTRWTTVNNLDESFPQIAPHLHIQVAENFIFDDKWEGIPAPSSSFPLKWFQLGSSALGRISLPSKFSLQG